MLMGPPFSALTCALLSLMPPTMQVEGSLRWYQWWAGLGRVLCWAVTCCPRLADPPCTSLSGCALGSCFPSSSSLASTLPEWTLITWVRLSRRLEGLPIKVGWVGSPYYCVPALTSPLVPLLQLCLVTVALLPICIYTHTHGIAVLFRGTVGLFQRTFCSLLSSIQPNSVNYFSRSHQEASQTPS